MGAIAFVKAQHQVEPRNIPWQGFGPNHDTVKMQVGIGRVLQCEHDLKQGLSREGTFGLQNFDHALEGQVLVGVGSQIELTNTANQFAERRPP